ncbi:MAG: type II toxin-antitoxin system RelE/ParE family toxin [Terracidiphilus sp.]
MQAVVETLGYLKSAEKLFSEAEREHIVAMVAAEPECGELIQGTGGFRKVRVGRGGMGKRGGARVIYILRGDAFPIFLIAAYAKNEKENLTQKERNKLAKHADEIFKKYRS